MAKKNNSVKPGSGFASGAFHPGSRADTTSMWHSINQVCGIQYPTPSKKGKKSKKVQQQVSPATQKEATNQGQEFLGKLIEKQITFLELKRGLNVLSENMKPLSRIPDQRKLVVALVEGGTDPKISKSIKGNLCYQKFSDTIRAAVGLTSLCEKPKAPPQPPPDEDKLAANA